MPFDKSNSNIMHVLHNSEQEVECVDAMRLDISEATLAAWAW